MISAMTNICRKHLHLQSLTTVLIVLYLTASIVEQQLRYDPVDDIAIDCGFSGNNTSLDPRSWIGDINSKYFSQSEGRNKDSVTLEASEQQIVDMVPYRTARLSFSEFTYYHVSLTADALGWGAIKREFCVTAEQSSLNMKFTPSSLISGAFAFVNGIEVVSMPSNLYYSEAGDNEIRLLEWSDFFNLENSTALETMYRINIGGNAISPLYDTGMFRQWDKEDDYLTVEGVSALPVLTTSTDLKFRDNLSSYAAPADVYKTARSTGDVRKEKNLVRSYNLTWEFPVDSGFEHNFDVVLYSGGQYKPYFRDYVDLKFGEGGQKKINLSVALQANPIDANTGYVDAILNGLEIIKLSDTTGNLAGPNPDRIQKVVSNISPSPKK
ncbi:hypothetical protein TIFTF001_042192 [Ficus carica]|uniref:Malectin-like domain-containing protein n=1 Tax=Ficus carica TaxID=3494 RepID=A0AA87ZLH5_FICCA|nr:hypothetical protein TIFTF001_042192 [Ficus carica]